MLPLEVQIDAMSNVRSQLISMRDSVRTGEFKDIGGAFGASAKACCVLRRTIDIYIEI